MYICVKHYNLICIIGPSIQELTQNEKRFITFHLEQTDKYKHIDQHHKDEGKKYPRT